MYKNNPDEKLLEQYMSKDPGLIARYLGVKKYKMKTMFKCFPSYKKALFCKSVTEVVKDFDERVVFDINNYGGIVTASYQFLEVGRDNSEELMVSGFRFLLKDDIRLSVSVEQDPWTGAQYLTLSYANEHASEALLFFKSVEEYMQDNNFYKGEKIDINGKFLALTDIGFDEVVLPEIDKKSIKMGALDFFTKQELYTKNNIPYKRGLIFTGVPGTGKTLTGKILMNNCESTFLWVTADILSKAKYDGASKITKNLFNMARELSPCILFIEDVDDFLEKEGAVDAIKTQMDGMDKIDGIVTILCTNYPDRLPMSLIDRPSRFDDVVLFSLPDEDLRFTILRKVGEPMDIDNRETVLKAIAEKTDGLTGSHLKEIMVYALLLSVDDGRETINDDDLAKALIKVLNTKETITDKLSEVNVKTLISEIKKAKGDNNE